MEDNAALWELRWTIETYTFRDELENRSKKELCEFITTIYDQICEYLNR